MSAGGFLSRWSRRKAEVREAEARAAEKSAVTETAKPQKPDAEPEIDLSALPPVESLTAESDYTVFLAKGVPEALRTTALRKLWLTDPSVRDYRPLVEYNWDFNAPGYGELLSSDDVQKFVTQVMSGHPREEKRPVDPVNEDDAKTAASQEPQPSPPAPDSLLAAVDSEPEPDQVADAVAPAIPVRIEKSALEPSPEPIPRRRHGGAIPT